MNTAFMKHSSEVQPAAADWPRDRIRAIVTRILAAHSNPKPFSDDDTLTEIGVGSVDMVALLLAVENEFAVDVPQHDITPEVFRSVASICAMVQRLAARQPAEAHASWCLSTPDESEMHSNVAR